MLTRIQNIYYYQQNTKDTHSHPLTLIQPKPSSPQLLWPASSTSSALPYLYRPPSTASTYPRCITMPEFLSIIAPTSAPREQSSKRPHPSLLEDGCSCRTSRAHVEYNGGRVHRRRHPENPVHHTVRAVFEFLQIL